MIRVTLVFVAFSVVQSASTAGANVDSPFAVDPEEVQLKEISENVRRVSGAVMGLTEYVMEIRNELKTIRSDISPVKVKPLKLVGNTTSRPLTYYSGRPQRDPEEVRRQSLELADKVERLLAMDQSPEVDLAKEELKRTVEKNFLRMLAAILVTGPMHTQERSDDIFKLMRSVLNGELDFTPVVQRLPLILRDSETNQFVNLLITLRESERGGSAARGGPLTSVENTATASAKRQLLPFPIPSSPISSPIGSAPISRPSGNPPVNANINVRPAFLAQNTNNFNGNNFPGNNFPGRPSQFQNTINTNNQYQPGSLLQQANQNNNANNVNRLPPNNGNGVNPNQGNVNNNGQLNGAAGGGGGVGGEGGENVNGQPGQQGNQLPTINSLIDAMSQTNQLIKEIPSLVEGLQTLVESIEGLFG